MVRIYNSGMTTLSGGNLSILDEDGTMWITPAGRDKGALIPGDIMRVDPDGSVHGPHTPSSEYPFHKAIYAQRPDLRAIVHAHAPALVAFSIARQIPDTHIISQAHRICGPVGYAAYAPPGTVKLGENIAAAFAKGHNVVMLENHGAATGGPDLITAFQRLETVDFCARTLINASELGEITSLQDAEIDRVRNSVSAGAAMPEFDPGPPTSQERALRSLIVTMTRRACQRQLMNSTEGVVSARLDDGSFLITPAGLDRSALQIEEIVLMRDGARERGKIPSRSAPMHRAIYAQQPEIHSVITAQSPYAMAYAVTHAQFDSRTIPESYVMLRTVPRLPFGNHYAEPDEIARLISPQSPVLMIQNDCTLTAGKDITQAFDRLEVAEFSARSLIDTARFATLRPIGPEEIRELEVAFNL